MPEIYFSFKLFAECCSHPHAGRSCSASGQGHQKSFPSKDSHGMRTSDGFTALNCLGLLFPLACGLYMKDLIFFFLS